MGKVSVVNIDDLLSRSGLRPTARSAGVSLFDSPDSVRLLELCERLGIGVLGIEGFTLSNDDLFPEVDYIGDFSVLLGRDDFEVESVKAARRFVQLAMEVPHLLFEYVLANRDTSTAAAGYPYEQRRPERWEVSDSWNCGHRLNTTWTSAGYAWKRYRREDRCRNLQRACKRDGSVRRGRNGQSIERSIRFRSDFGNRVWRWHRSANLASRTRGEYCKPRCPNSLGASANEGPEQPEQSEFLKMRSLS